MTWWLAVPELFSKAIRAAESADREGDYAAVRGLVRGSARLLGAYGIPSDNWEALAEDAGYAGARWQDPRAQDAVVEYTFQRLYQKYGDWRLVAAAWKAGEEAADVIAQYPQLLKEKSMAPLKAYISQVMSHAREELTVNPPDLGEDTDPYHDPASYPMDLSGLSPSGEIAMPQSDSDEALVRRLYAMRNLYMKRGISDPDIQQEVAPPVQLEEGQGGPPEGDTRVPLAKRVAKAIRPDARMGAR